MHVVRRNGASQVRDEWEETAAAHGLASVTAAEGLAVGFLIREEEWKAFALLQFGLAAKEGFRRKDVFSAIKANGWVAQRFGYVGEEVAASMRRAAERDLRTPWEAVGDFLDGMEKAGMLMPPDLRGRIAGGKRLYGAIKEAADLRERPGKRKEQLRGLVSQTLSPVRAAFKEGFDFEAWLDLPDGNGVAPSQAILSDDGSFEELAGKLERLRAEMWMRPPQVTESLGLPVLEEAQARAAAHCAAEERRAKEAAEKVEREAGDREASLAKSVMAAMGAASERMSSPQDSLGGLSPAAMARRSQSYWKASDALDRWRSAVREEGERQARRRQGRLQEGRLRKTVDAPAAERTQGKATRGVLHGCRDLGNLRQTAAGEGAETLIRGSAERVVCSIVRIGRGSRAASMPRAREGISGCRTWKLRSAS
ncbi:hypothetical protein [Pseudaminobacter sp. NGMCC 1.201702]|uniref:hypothetical protein n=1 Tax=Pseudaminobacter sp. NGMCC 1.201702 TaxID=3391825 RepID=UPI0039EECD27